MCLQFQVNTYCMPLTAAMAMWSASVAAFSGSGTPARSDFANEPTCFDSSSSASACNPARGSGSWHRGRAAHVAAACLAGAWLRSRASSSLQSLYS